MAASRRRCWPARFPESDLGDVAPEELSALPGVQEVLGLHEVGELAGIGQMGPRRGGLRVDRRCAADADAARDVRPVPGAGLAAAPQAVSSAPTTRASAAMVELVERIDAGTEQLTRAADRRRLGQRAPGADRRAGGRRRGGRARWARWRLMGVRVAELIVNQILVQDDSYEYRNLPEHPAFDWYSERISEQRAVLDELDATIGDVQLVLVPHLAGEPIGAQGAGRTARQRRAARRLAAARPVAARRRSGVRLRAGCGVPVAARVAAGRLRRADAGPGRRRLDHRRRRDAAPGSAGVGAAAMHRDGRTAARAAN